MKLKFLLYFLIVAIQFSCERNQQEYSMFFLAEPKSERSIEVIDSCILNSFILDHIESSYIGDVHFYQDTLYFVDNLFCYIYIFNTEGKYIDRKLGMGNGPTEISSNIITGFSKTSEGDFVVIGGSQDIYLFDSQWSLIKKSLLKRDNLYSKNEINKSPQGHMQQIYDIDYEKNMNVEVFKDHIYLPIESLCDRFNPVMSEYYQTSRILFEINLKTSLIQNMLGRRSPVYKNYNHIGQFSWFNYDIDENGNFYISFEPDSIIYVYDEHMNNISSFGCGGIDMNTNYKESLDLMETGMHLEEERKTKGYYTSIEYVDECNLLFRNYQKGANKSLDGLQVYKENILIADVEVSKGFKVIGYKKPFIYATGMIDDEAEEIVIYKINESQFTIN